jgi:Flp pilus assembly protein TadD
MNTLAASVTFVGLCLILPGCTISSVSAIQADDGVVHTTPSQSQTERSPSSLSCRRLTGEYVNKGLANIREGNYESAELEFGKALRSDPQNSYLHFLNGFAYHLQADRSNAGLYKYARIGYELALKFDPNNWLAAKQLGQLFLYAREYRKARGYFASALAYQPGDATLLYGLAQASYYIADIPTALGAVTKAAELMPGSPAILGSQALITAAAGNTETAERMLSALGEQHPTYPRMTFLKERIADWQLAYANALDSTAGSVTNKPDSSNSYTSVSVAVDSALKVPKMVVVDVVILRTEENESSNKGINFLDNLALTFEGSSGTATPGGTWALAAGTLDASKLAYNLNIFNAGGDRTEALAMPTLIALDGKQSTSFAGTTLNVAVKGVQTASISALDAGVTLEVLPTFLSENTIQLHVLARRTFLEDGAVGSFQEAVRTTKNEVTTDVVLSLGQTLILGGLREKEISSVKSSVPILGDIPILEYLFSHKVTHDYHKSLLMLLTPRRVTPGIYRSLTGKQNEVAAEDSSAVEMFSEHYGYLLSHRRNLDYILRHLAQHALMKELKCSDFFDEPGWGDPESVEKILRRAASFLYY